MKVSYNFIRYKNQTDRYDCGYEGGGGGNGGGG